MVAETINASRLEQTERASEAANHQIIECYNFFKIQWQVLHVVAAPVSLQKLTFADSVLPITVLNAPSYGYAALRGS